MDTVLRGHPAFLTGFVIGRNGSPGVAPPNVLFPALLRAASPTIFLGAGEGRRAGLEGLETRREISGLPGPSSAKFGFQGGRMLHNSDKEFTLTMGGGCGMLEGGRHGAGVRYKEPEGGREVSPTTYPNELIRIYKD